MSLTPHQRIHIWLGTDGNDLQNKLRRIVLSKGIHISRCAAVMLVESGGQHDIISPAGATGLMQVMPCDCPEPYRRYFADRPTTAQLKVPCVNVAWGCEILRSCYLRWGPNWMNAYAAYLGGINSDGTPTEEGYHYATLVNSSIPAFADLDTEVPT